MPPVLASFLTTIFIILLFRRDNLRYGDVPSALWIPIIWMTITGSRFVSQWLNLGSHSAEQEGTVIDVIFFLSLILFGAKILIDRKINFTQLIKHNIGLSFFLAYCFISIIWSDDPLVATKRYIKILGHPIMALIILTEPNPGEALRILMKRIAYLLIPVSILFLKYYPQYGRGFDPWTGSATNSGAMLTKNELGIICLLFGLFFYWNLLIAKHIEDSSVKREEFLLSAVFLVMIGWLQYMSQCSTTLACLIIGIGATGVVGFRIVSKRFIGTYIVVAVIVAFGVEVLFNFYETVIEMLGEDPTLTDRTIVWQDCLALVENPLLGTGFESFWMGERLAKLWAKWWWHPNQAHNGYVEMYLNLGIIGILFFICFVIDTFRKIGRELLTNYEFARLKFGFFFAILALNYAEATFKGVSIVWTVFNIIAIENLNQLSFEAKPKANNTGKNNLRKHTTFRYKKPKFPINN